MRQHYHMINHVGDEMVWEHSRRSDRRILFIQTEWVLIKDKLNWGNSRGELKAWILASRQLRICLNRCWIQKNKMNSSIWTSNHRKLKVFDWVVFNYTHGKQTWLCFLPSIYSQRLYPLLLLVLPMSLMLTLVAWQIMSLVFTNEYSHGAMFYLWINSSIDWPITGQTLWKEFGNWM
jgi:hypothetical protein